MFRFPLFIDIIKKFYSKSEKDGIIAKHIIEILMTEGVGNSSDIISFFNDIIDEKEDNHYKYCKILF